MAVLPQIISGIRGLFLKGTTNNGSTNPIEVYDSDGNLVTEIDSDGGITTDGDITTAGGLTAKRISQSGGTMRFCQYLDAFRSGGGGGATAVEPTANTAGGWQLNSAGEDIYFHCSVCNNWDGASDLTFQLQFEVNTDNTGGSDTDTVDIRVRAYMKAPGDTTAKLQTLENAVVVGKSARYKAFQTSFTLDYDDVTNPVEVGDIITFMINLETDSSEVDDIIVNHGRFSYRVDKILPEPS
jgi:hypothetical protein